MAGEHRNHVLALDIRSRRMGHERVVGTAISAVSIYLSHRHLR